MGQRAVYSWKVQVPQTWTPERWTFVSSTAWTWKPCQMRPGAVSTSRVRTLSMDPNPYAVTEPELLRSLRLS